MAMLGRCLKSGLVAGMLAAAAPATSNDMVASNMLAPLPGIKYSATKASQSASPDEVTKNYEIMHSFRGMGTNSRSAAAVLAANQRQLGGYGYENITSTTAYGTQYGVNVNFYETPLTLLLDTAGSDTWVVQDGYQCLDSTGRLTEQATCGFGVSYQADFQYGPIPAEHLYIKYRDGESVFGRMGYSDVTVGGIPVKKQQVGFVNSTHWKGNGMMSGLVGLGYPSLTHGYLGNGTEHTALQQVMYSPLFTTMVNEGLVAPYFSIAIERNSSGGLIGFGGIPPTSGVDVSTVAHTDIVITNLLNSTSLTWDYSYYTIVPDGFNWGTTADARKYPYIIDAGTTLMYLPPPLAEAINAAFMPAAVYLPGYNAYFTSCDAVAPPVSVVINGLSMTINPVDLMYRDMIDPATGLCMTGIASGGTGPYILGDVFLQNVLAIFDVGHGQMRFMNRQFY